MDKCCGPFKRGRPAKAVVPSQQCFADCCGNLCPPDGCCDLVRVRYNCGCGCDCAFKGYNFGGLTFKKKKSRNTGIPTFSKKTLEANGFTFAAATVPTPTSSSSSSSCECSPLAVELTTDGCCLYLGPGGVEAVGGGKVTAEITGSPSANCHLSVLLNGVQANEAAVVDGEIVTVELSGGEQCECCEVQRECVTNSTGMWAQKSNRDRKTLVLDKGALEAKARFAAERVRGRRRRP